MVRARPKVRTFSKLPGALVAGPNLLHEWMENSKGLLFWDPHGQRQMILRVHKLGMSPCGPSVQKFPNSSLPFLIPWDQNPYGVNTPVP